MRILVFKYCFAMYVFSATFSFAMQAILKTGPCTGYYMQFYY